MKSKFSNTITSTSKRDAWEEITVRVNAVNLGTVRFSPRHIFKPACYSVPSAHVDGQNPKTKPGLFRLFHLLP